MTRLTMKAGGEVTLPASLCQRYGLTPDVPIGVIETRTGFLLIPLTKSPMDPALEAEIAAWQQLGSLNWDAFPYEEQVP